MEFPIWKHHPEHGEKLVRTSEELAALGAGWSDDSSVWRKHLLENPAEIKEPVFFNDKESVEVVKVEQEVAKENKKAAKKSAK